MKKAIAEIVPEAAWQRCYVHFLRNALDYLPRKADDDCMQELRWLYDRRNLAEAQRPGRLDRALAKEVSHLPQCGELPALGAGAVRRNP